MSQNFQRISNNQEKGKAYKHQIERFNLAKEGGFYFECIFILYVLMEEINLWHMARNELVHAPLNRNIEGMEEKLIGLTEEGERYWRHLNTFMNAFTKNNPNRKKFNIQ